MPIILAGAVCKGLTKKKIGSGSGAALKVAAPGGSGFGSGSATLLSCHCSVIVISNSVVDPGHLFRILVFILTRIRIQVRIRTVKPGSGS